MTRVQTLVQLDDRLLGLLDERALSRGTSRSALVREAIEAYVADDAEARVDAAIAEGYRLRPPGELRAETEARAIASIEEEPW